jgi:TPR repeat protein
MTSLDVQVEKALDWQTILNYDLKDISPLCELLATQYQESFEKSVMDFVQNKLDSKQQEHLKIILEIVKKNPGDANQVGYNLERKGYIKEAYLWYLKAAQRGCMIGQYNLGIFYYHGRGGVVHDEKEGIRWFTRSSEKGYALAFLQLGRVYAGKDAKKAAKYFELGFQHDEPNSKLRWAECCRYGCGVEKNVLLAIEILKTKPIDDAAKCELGFIYDFETEVQDWKEAVKWYLAAGVNGIARAQHNLATAYAHGDGIAQDPVSAVEWWTRAAEKGYANSQAKLAHCYEIGLGVAKNEELSEKWLKEAAKNGYAGAKDKLSSSSSSAEPPLKKAKIMINN